MTFVKRHGLTHTTEHRLWVGIRMRCNSPYRADYYRYGGRGIRVCERWDTFENFLADLSYRPGPEYTIERINNDGNYEPSNCKWILRAEQNKNRCNVYTAEEDQRIREAVALGYNFTQAAEYVGKSKSSVMMRAYRLGLKSGQPAKRPYATRRRNSELSRPQQLSPEK